MKTILKDVLIFDGSLQPAKKGFIVLNDKLIEDVVYKDFDSSDYFGDKVVDCKGLCACPGIIDIHAHSDLEILRNPSFPAKINQGITTDVSGNCGVGVFPIKEGVEVDLSLLTDILGPYDDINFKDYNSYKERLNSDFSILMLQSHSMLRFNAIKGNPNREATDSEIKHMCDLLDESLSQGALGLSTGLYYAPCIYASEKELIELFKVVKKHKKFVAVHHRCEGSDIINSLKEIIGLVEKVGVDLEISHLKIVGMKNQHLLNQVISLVENCKYILGFDQYPYSYGSTSLKSMLPPSVLSLDSDVQHLVLKDKTKRKEIISQMKNPQGWDSLLELCGAENIKVTALSHFPEYEQKTLYEIASIRNQDPYECFLDLMAEETGLAMMIDRTENEEVLKTLFNHPLSVFGTDALYNGGAEHPRSYEAVPHMLEQSFREKMSCTLEYIIHRMSGKTANRLKLKDRGFLKPGLKGDVVIFDKTTGKIENVYLNGLPKLFK